MLKTRGWVLEIQKDYVKKLLDQSEIQAMERSKETGKPPAHFLQNGIRTLFKLQDGDNWVTNEQMKNSCAVLRNSPSVGQFAWLDEYDNKYGAGIVEKGTQNNRVVFRIKKAFYKAVSEVLEAKAR